ncbi:two-component hybrid sensor and regulator [Beggiatoa sp. PS]|nr:two-component hybrid sensor and regulator [Beggiatoa sp. PS]
MALMIPITITIIAGIALNKTNILKYEYDNLYGFMLIPLLDVDKGNLHREKLSSKLHELTHAELSLEQRTTITEEIKYQDRMMIEFIARYESEWLTTLSPEFTAVLATLGQQHLQQIEAETLIQFHQVYDAFILKRDALLSGQTMKFKELKQYLEQMEATFEVLVKVNRQFADYSNESAQQVITHMRWTLVVWGILLSLMAFGIAWWFARHVTKPVSLLSQAIQYLAQGHLNADSALVFKNQINKIVRRQDEIGEIGRAFKALNSYFQEVIADIVQVSQGLAEGNQHITSKSEYRGDFSQIQIAFKAASLKLAETMRTNANQDWLKTGQTQLNEKLRGELDVVKLAKHTLDFLATYVNAQIGLFYLVSQDKLTKCYLQEKASYAYVRPHHLSNQFKIGEGLVGQAALEKQILYRTHTPKEYIHLNQSGLANVVPRHVLFIPFLYENAVKGVIELGFSKALTTLQREFLELITPSLGIAVNTAESRTKMQELLEQSQRQMEELQAQSEKLQVQQEEMQHINEALQKQRAELQTKQTELQHQNEELQSQSEELQTQQEELRQTNEALEERSQELERQKAAIQQKNQALEKTQLEMDKARTAAELKARELELANRYKSEFLANMSHELRTPLNSLLILAQLLVDNKHGNLNDKQVEYAKTIHSSGADLLKLINEILDLAKVEAGKIEIHNEDISLADLVETLEHKFHPLIEEQDLNFQITVANDLPDILHTDRQRLTQILNNLLSNAFKFTSQGEVRLKIQSASSLSGPHPSPLPEGEGENIGPFLLGEGQLPRPLGEGRGEGLIIFSITDSGIGIPNDKQQVIFEAFQQADGTTSRRYGGTGLGLSISRQLARLLGGDILLHSEENKGSTFTLCLPLQNTNSKASEVHKLSGSEVLALPTTVSSPDNPVTLTIEKNVADDRNNFQLTDNLLLIVEDDPKFARLMVELAHEQQFKCLVGEDGLTGLQLAEQYNPHAIILDVGLPHLDGWKVMEQLKNNPDTRHIPVHFISAFDQSLAAKKMGAIGYLLKPVSMEQLSETFQKIETFMANTVKSVLVVVDNEVHQQQILNIVSGDNIQTTLAATTIAALQNLKETTFDCIILDLEIEQRAGCQLLEQMQTIEGFCQTQVIVYAKRELTSEEKALLMQCADELPVKSVSSPERLLNEVTLFLHQVEANLPKDKRNMLHLVHDKEAILAEKKVLIVDDDARNTFALAIVLEEKQMEVIAGNNGFEALKLLDEHQDIAIVLMDIMMPEMDGYEAMRQIRARDGFRKLPIIALTAKAMKSDKAKCIEAGANDYLSKPVDTDKLISLMRVWLYR